MLNKIFMNKYFCAALVVAAFIFGIWFPFYNNDPLQVDGTVSILGERYPALFWVWALLSAAAFFIGIKYMYKKFACKSRLADALLIIAAAGMLAVALTLGQRGNHLLTVIHWLGAIIFALANGVALLLFFVRGMKIAKSFRVTGAVVAVVIAGMVVWLCTVGKSGLLEALPMEFMFILIFIADFTNIYPSFEKEKINIK